MRRALSLALLLFPLAVGACPSGGRTLPSTWRGEIIPRTGAPIPGNSRLKYEFVLVLDTFEDGHVTGTMEWPSEITKNTVKGELVGEELTLMDDEGDRKDAHVQVEDRGSCRAPRTSLRGTDKGGLWQLTAVADRSGPILTEKLTNVGAPGATPTPR